MYFNSVNSKIETRISKLKAGHQKWLQQYIGILEQTNKSPNTIKNYTFDLVQFLTWFELKYPQVMIHESPSSTINDYLSALSAGAFTPQYQINTIKQNWAFNFFFKIKNFLKFKTKSYEKSFDLILGPLSVASKRRHLCTIKNFFSFLKELHDGELFINNPVKARLHQIKLTDGDQTPTFILKEEDWHKVNESITKPKDRLMAMLLYVGGLRLDELRHLKIGDMDFERRVLTFIRKGRKRHELKVKNFEQLGRLWKHVAESRSLDEHLFLSNKLEPFSHRGLFKHMRSILDRALVTTNITPHSFRKACATNLYKTSKDLLYVKSYLNHKDAKVTQTYIDQHALGIETQLPN